MDNNERIITEFIAAWSRLDAAELAGYFTDDGVYNNIPVGPVAGKTNIENFIKSFTADWAETTWELLNIYSKDNVVITERMDRTKARNGELLELPGLGIFELEGDKIKIWRDYFDLGTYLKVFQ